jgi:hypothetical protein
MLAATRRDPSAHRTDLPVRPSDRSHDFTIIETSILRINFASFECLADPALMDQSWPKGHFEVTPPG